MLGTYGRGMAALEHWLPVMFTDARQAVELAQAAEQAGFTGIALADHVAVPAGYESVHPSGERVVEMDGEFPDPFVVAATMLAVTTRLQVMTYVYIVTMRDPWSVAKGAGTLSLMSGGRFGLGVGAAWLLEEIELLGHDPSTRGKRMDADLATIRSLLRTGPASSPSGVEVGMAPVPDAPPPIWVGGKSRAAQRRAARYDGWLGMNYPVEETFELLDRVAALRAEEGGAAPGAMTMVVPIAEPTPALHEELAGPRRHGDARHALDARRSGVRFPRPQARRPRVLVRGLHPQLTPSTGGGAYARGMSQVIKINAITVPADSGDELARRFAARAGAVDDQDGFEGFELLKPTDDRTTWLVVTRWRDEESFQAWVPRRRSATATAPRARRQGAPAEGAPGAGGHPGGGHPGGHPGAHGGGERPVGVNSEVWSYTVAGGSPGKES